MWVSGSRIMQARDRFIFMFNRHMAKQSGARVYCSRKGLIINISFFQGSARVRRRFSNSSESEHTRSFWNLLKFRSLSYFIEAPAQEGTAGRNLLLLSR